MFLSGWFGGAGMSLVVEEEKLYHATGMCCLCLTTGGSHSLMDPPVVRHR